MSRKLTTEEYRAKLEKTRHGMVKLLSEYDGATNPVRVKFMGCGHEVPISKPYNLLNGSGCPICKDKKRRMSNKEFRQRVYNLVGDDYTVASTYVNMRTRVHIIHNKCGNKDWWPMPERFLNGDRCPKCSSKAKKDTAWYKQKVKEMYGDEYTVLSEYDGVKNPIHIQHECGYDWWPNAGNFRQGYSHCPECSRKKLREQEALSVKEVVSRITEIFNGTIVLDNPEKEYENGNSQLHYHCTVCGEPHHAQAGNLLQGHGCPTCADQHRNDDRRFTIEELKQRIKDKSNGTYEYVSGNYKNNVSPIKVRHLDCNHIFTTNWMLFRQGSVTCKHCRGSFGEQQVKGYLDQHGLDYEFGYVIPDLKDRKRLHFDLWLAKYKIAIEYDGVQHFKPTQFNQHGNKSAKEQYKLTVKHDRMKDQYCKEKGIKLIRIKYDQDVNTVLDKELKNIINK